MTKEDLEQMGRGLETAEQAEKYLKQVNTAIKNNDYKSIDSMDIFDANKRAQTIIFEQKEKPLREQAEQEKAKLEQLQYKLYDVEDKHRNRCIRANRMQDEMRHCKPWELSKKRDLAQQIEELRKSTDVEDIEKQIKQQQATIDALKLNADRWDDIGRLGNSNELRLLTRCETIKFYTQIQKNGKKTETPPQRTTSPIQPQNDQSDKNTKNDLKERLAGHLKKLNNI